jgi:hypothetical protein
MFKFLLMISGVDRAEGHVFIRMEVIDTISVIGISVGISVGICVVGISVIGISVVANTKCSSALNEC